MTHLLDRASTHVSTYKPSIYKPSIYKLSIYKLSIYMSLKSSDRQLHTPLSKQSLEHITCLSASSHLHLLASSHLNTLQIF